MTIRDQIKASRTAAGLRLAFLIPDRAEPFICYPKDAASKEAWLRNAAQRGWQQIPTNGVDQ